MLLTREQVEKLHTAFQDDPKLTFVTVRDVPNGSGIGPDTQAVFRSGNLLFGEQEHTLDITDESTW